jgi:hypothetical protein
MFCSVDFEREGELVPRPCVDGSFMMPNFSVKTTLIRTRNQRVVSWEKEAFLSLIDGLNCSCLRIFPQLSVHLKRVLECTRLSLFDGLFSDSSLSPKYLSGHRHSPRTCCTAALFALSIYVCENKERGKASVLLSLNEAWPFLACLGHPSLSSATAIRSIIVVVFWSLSVSFSNQAEWDNQSVVK